MYVNDISLIQAIRDSSYFQSFLDVQKHLPHVKQTSEQLMSMIAQSPIQDPNGFEDLLLDQRMEGRNLFQIEDDRDLLML